MPVDSYRRPPEDDPPSRRPAFDEISWALLSMAALAALRVLLGVIRGEGLSTDVNRALSILIPTVAIAVYRAFRAPSHAD